MASHKFLANVEFNKNEALNFRTQNITGVGDWSLPVGGMLGFMSANGDKRLAFYDDEVSQLIKVPRLDRAESVTGQYSFAPTIVQAPFTLGANALSQLVTGLNADLLDGFNSAAAATASTIPVRDAAGRMKAAAPVADDDVTIKSWVIDTVYGIITSKIEARVRATGNVNIASPPAASDAVWDGITLATNDRVFLNNQSTGSQNGLWVYNGVGVAMTRTSDADTDDEVSPGMTFFVSEGTLWGNTRWQLITDDPITLDTTSLVFTQIGGATDIVAGPGIAKNGNELYVKLGSAGSPAGRTYTQGAIVYCDTTSSLNMTAALSGILQGNGTSAPSAITGLTAGTLPKYSASAPFLTNSILVESGSTIVLGASGEATFSANATGGGGPITLYSNNAAPAAIYWKTGTDLRFGTTTNGVGSAGFSESWRITGAGILQAPSAQTVQTLSGHITIKSAGGDGKVILTAHGAGYVNITSTTTTGAGIYYDGNATANRAFLGMVNGSDAVFRLYSAALTHDVQRWDLANGFVSISASGIETPATIFQVRKDAAETFSAGVTATADHVLRLRNLNTTANAYTGVSFVNGSTGTTHSGIYGVRTSADNADLVFVAEGTGTPAEKWRMTGAGILQSPVSQTIQTATGSLTLKAVDGGGNLYLSPGTTTGRTVVEGLIACMDESWAGPSMIGPFMNNLLTNRTVVEGSFATATTGGVTIASATAVYMPGALVNGEQRGFSQIGGSGSTGTVEYAWTGMSLPVPSDAGFYPFVKVRLTADTQYVTNIKLELRRPDNTTWDTHFDGAPQWGLLGIWTCPKLTLTVSPAQYPITGMRVTLTISNSLGAGSFIYLSEIGIWGRNCIPGFGLYGHITATNYWTGTNYFSGSVRLTAMTSGSVLFAGASGAITQDNANLFWDDTNNRLGIGTAAPNSPLHLAGATPAVTTWQSLTVQANDSFAADKGGSIGFAGKYDSGGSLANFAAIRGLKENATDGNVASYLSLCVRAAGGNVGEAWRITSTGILQAPGAQTIQTSSSTLTIQPAGDTALATTSGNVGIGTAVASNARLYVVRSGVETVNNTSGQFFNTSTATANGLVKYGLVVSVTGSFGTSSGTAHGVFISAVSGGVTANWALYNNTSADVYLGTGRASLGTLPGSTTYFRIGSVNVPASMSGTSGYGVYCDPIWLSTHTSEGAASIFVLRTQAASFTMGSGVAVYAGVPNIGAGSTITSIYGFRALNQGVSGTTTSYGLYIDAQSGSTTNWGIYCAGTGEQSHIGHDLRLGVTAATANSERLTVDNGDAIIASFSRSGGSAANTGIAFVGASAAYFATGIDTSGRMAWKYNSADLSTSPLMVLETSGNLGVNGVPSERFTVREVATATDLVVGFRTVTSGAASTRSIFTQGANNGDLTLAIDQGSNGAARAFILKMVATEVLRVNLTGQLLVGTTTGHSKLTVVTNSLGTTQTDTSGLALVNETAAGAGAQQISPAVRLVGYGWKTDATASSQPVAFRVHVVPVQGAAAPTGYLTLQSSINGAAYSELLRIGNTQLTASAVVLTDSNRQLTATVALGVANGGTGTSTAFTAGSVVFAGAAGVYTQSNAQFFWNNTHNTLCLGSGDAGAAGVRLSTAGGTAILRYDANAQSDILKLQNLDTTASANQSITHRFEFARTGSAAPIVAAYLHVVKAQEWTSTASTQDAALGIYAANDGTAGLSATFGSAWCRLGDSLTMTDPAVRLFLQGGTTTRAPIQFGTGSLLTTPVTATVEYDGSFLYFTRTGGRRRIAQVHEEAIGNGSATSIAVTHNLGSRDVTVEVYEAATPYDKVSPEVEHTDANNVTIKFTVAPASGAYKVVVIG